MKGLTVLVPSYDGVGCVSPELSPDPFASSHLGSIVLGRGLWPPVPSTISGQIPSWGLSLPSTPPASVRLRNDSLTSSVSYGSAAWPLASLPQAVKPP